MTTTPDAMTPAEIDAVLADQWYAEQKAQTTVASYRKYLADAMPYQRARYEEEIAKAEAEEAEAHVARLTAELDAAPELCPVCPSPAALGCPQCRGTGRPAALARGALRAAEARLKALDEPDPRILSYGRLHRGQGPMGEPAFDLAFYHCFCCPAGTWREERERALIDSPTLRALRQAVATGKQTGPVKAETVAVIVAELAAGRRARDKDREEAEQGRR